MIVLFGTSSLPYPDPGRPIERATTRGDFVWLGLEPWAYLPRYYSGVATMHNIPYLFGGEDVEGELDWPTSQCGVAGRILMP